MKKLEEQNSRASNELFTLQQLKVGNNALYNICSHPCFEWNHQKLYGVCSPSFTKQIKVFLSITWGH